MLIIDSYFDTFWLWDVLARIIGGLVAYLLWKSLHEFFFGIIAALITAVGFAFFIAFESNHQVNLMYAGMIWIGTGSGMWWVLAPMIIHDDAGPKSFSLLWGSILTMNFSGILFFTMVYILIWANIANAASMIYILSLSSWIFAAIVCTYSFAQERKEKWLNVKQE